MDERCKTALLRMKLSHLIGVFEGMYDQQVLFENTIKRLRLKVRLGSVLKG